MQKLVTIVYLGIFFICSLVLYAEPAAGTGVEGTIKDAQTGETLLGANVILLGTSMGASTDNDGVFSIRNVPAGKYVIRVSYIGYEPLEVEVTVTEGSVLKQDFRLSSVAVLSEEILITSQAEGQLQAINKQLASDQIINAVSAARIQELPDANAAESVSRLPGVSVLRSGGEGDRVVIRGLAPKYNNITINGVKVASTGADERSVDLSMISSTMLEGIQVSKTITPDMDANAIGGVVNFEMREARVDEPGVPKFSLLAQGTYNGLSNAIDKLHNYKFVVTGENRFMDDKLGVFAQFFVEKKNLSSNELGASYIAQGNSPVNYLTQSITLDDVTRDRQRYNAALNIDYQVPDGKIYFSNFFSTGKTEVIDRQQAYNLSNGQNTSNFTANFSEGTLNTFTNMLRYEQQISFFKVNASLSHSYNETKNPKDWAVSFITSPAGLGDFGNAENLDPHDVVAAATHDTSLTLLQTVSTNYSFARERILTGSLDFEIPLFLSDMVSTVFKFGGKYQYLKRSYDLNQTNGQNFGLQSGSEIIRQLKSQFPWLIVESGDVNVPLTSFIDSDYDYGEFLGGEYRMLYPLNFDRLHQVVDYMYGNQIPGNITYSHNIGGSITNDYWGREDVSAFYLMATVNVGQFLTVIPGVRYQQLKTVYTAPQGIQGPNSSTEYPHRMITKTQYHPYWLPDIIVRYKPLDWFDVRLAYTNSVSYPDYNSITPRINVAQSAGILQWNGFNLDPIRSQNYDVYFSVYNNTIGLFTAGVFLKQIKNLIYQYSFVPPSAQELIKYYPEWYDKKTPIAGIQVTEYVNNSYEIENYGMELDWQTHFWYLPGVLSGLVMNVNYTHIFSEAEYPYQLIIQGRPARYVDTSYYAPLLFQPDDIINLSLGYDYSGFSIRVSSIYSAKIFTGPSQREQVRSFTDAYNRWDIAVKQKLPVVGLGVYMNMNNINGAKDVSIINAPTGVPSQEQSYGYTLELGVEYKF